MGLNMALDKSETKTKPDSVAGARGGQLKLFSLLYTHCTHTV